MGVYVGQVVKAQGCERSEFSLQLCGRWVFCVRGKSSPRFVSLFLCRYSTCRYNNGVLAALIGLLQDVF